MTAVATGKPGIHQRFHFDIAAYDRVLTKIGLNLVAKLLGVPLIRNPAFDSAVAYVRDGVHWGRDRHCLRASFESHQARAIRLTSSMTARGIDGGHEVHRSDRFGIG
jgi:hypothetical protein